MSGNESARSTSPIAKKRRLQNACDACRIRKVRCDSGNTHDNTCSNCISLKLECQHTFEKKKRGPQPGRPRKPVKPPFHSLVADILSPSSAFVIPSEPSEIRKLLVDLAGRIRYLEKELSHARKLLRNSTHFNTANDSDKSTPASETPALVEPLTAAIDISCSPYADIACRESSEPAEDEQLSEQVEQLELFQTRDRYFGKLSRIMQVRAAIKIKMDSERSAGAKITSAMKRPAFWDILPWQRLPEPVLPPLLFPPDDLMVELIDLYFLNLNTFYPLLHRPTFEKLVNDGLHYRDRHFGETLLAVCALASQHSDDPRNLPEDSDCNSEHAFGWRWYRQVTQMPISLTNMPSLYEVQKYILSGIFLQASSTPEATWVMLAVGIRMAQDVGAHRKQKNRPSTVERELWKRAFWMLVFSDVLLSAIAGRPRAMTSNDFDIELPAECDDEYWEVSDSGLAFKQPEGKPSVMTYWIFMLKLMDVLALAHSTIYSTRNSRYFSELKQSQKIVSDIDAALSRWFDSLPDHLRWSPHRKHDIFSYQSVALYSIYYWIQIQVHRLYIPRPGQSSILTFPSLAICVNSARSCIHLVDAARQRRFFPIPFVQTAVFSAAIVLMVSIWRSKPLNVNIDVHKEMEDVYKCISVLHMYEERFQTAGRLCDILNEVISISDFSETSTAPSLKRVRDVTETSPSPSTSPRGLHQSADSPALLNRNQIDSGVSSSLPMPNSLSVHDPLCLSGGVSDYSPRVSSSTGQTEGSSVCTQFTQGSLNLDSYSSTQENVPGIDGFLTGATWQDAQGNLTFGEVDWSTFMASIDELLHSH